MKNSEAVKELRNRTGMGYGMCHEAWSESEGNMTKAIEILKQKGATRAEKLVDRSTDFGYLGVYRHHDGRLVTVVELKCESDFVSKSTDFRDLAENLAMHISVSESLSLQDILKQNAVFVATGTQPVASCLKEISAKTGENITIGEIRQVKI